MARTFRLLGLHPGGDFDNYATSALIRTPPAEAERRLGALAQAHLISHTSAVGRYTMHDLLRTYAAELVSAEETEQERQAALTALFDYYLLTTATSAKALYSDEAETGRLEAPDASISAVTDQRSALGWLDAERSNLLAISAYTAVHGWPDHTIRLADVLFRHHYWAGHLQAALAMLMDAKKAATLTGDRAAEATALSNLGLVHLWQGRYERAFTDLQQSLDLARHLGDHATEARVLSNLGTVYFQQGRYSSAAQHLQQALARAREVADSVGQAQALTNLGLVDERRGHYHEAGQHLREALALSREIGHRIGEADALVNLGVVYERTGDLDAARLQMQQALALYRETRNMPGEAEALMSLGAVERRNGQMDAAVDYYKQALLLYREVGDGRRHTGPTADGGPPGDRQLSPAGDHRSVNARLRLRDHGGKRHGRNDGR